MRARHESISELRKTVGEPLVPRQGASLTPKSNSGPSLSTAGLTNQLSQVQESDLNYCRILSVTRLLK